MRRLCLLRQQDDDVGPRFTLPAQAGFYLSKPPAECEEVDVFSAAGNDRRRAVFFRACVFHSVSAVADESMQARLQPIDHKGPLNSLQQTATPPAHCVRRLILFSSAAFLRKFPPNIATGSDKSHELASLCDFEAHNFFPLVPSTIRKV